MIKNKTTKNIITTTTVGEIAHGGPQQEYKRVIVNGHKIREHRYIFSQHIKRDLLKSEIIHHINGDISDNRIKNLTIMNPSSHSYFHKLSEQDKKKVIMVSGGFTKIKRNGKEIVYEIKEYPDTPLQLDLNGELCVAKIREQYKLSVNQMKIMQLLALNNRAFSPIEIYKLCDLINQNAVHRFIQRGLKNKWVRQLEIIPGVQINNLFAFYKEPDRLETGQIIKDHRYKYYEATKLGIRIFEINEKVSLL